MRRNFLENKVRTVGFPLVYRYPVPALPLASEEESERSLRCYDEVGGGRDAAAPQLDVRDHSLHEGQSPVRVLKGDVGVRVHGQVAEVVLVEIFVHDVHRGSRVHDGLDGDRVAVLAKEDGDDDERLAMEGARIGW